MRWHIGLMTGTVLDGNIDVAFLRTDGEIIEEFGYYNLMPYDEEVKALLASCSSLELVPKANDLYNFQQTVDISKLSELQKLTVKLRAHAEEVLYPIEHFNADVELSMFYAEYSAFQNVSF